MKEIICITCPNSCHMQVEEQAGCLNISGNRCKRGAEFAKQELTCPMRTFSTTVRTDAPEVPVLPVRVSEEIPKEKIFDVLRVIEHTTVREPLGRGDVLIPRVLGLSADVIVTSDRYKQCVSRRKKDE